MARAKLPRPEHGGLSQGVVQAKPKAAPGPAPVVPKAANSKMWRDNPFNFYNTFIIYIYILLNPSRVDFSTNCVRLG